MKAWWRASPALRRPGTIGLALVLLLNLGLGLAFTLPRYVGERSVESRVRTLQAEVESRRLELERADRRQRLLADNEQDARRLLQRLIGTREETLAPMLGELDVSAREFGLTLGAYSLTPEPVEDTPLTRLKITLPVEGRYTALVAFLRRLEHSKRFLTVDALKLSDRGAGQAHTTSLSLEISAYLRATPGESEGVARGR